MLMSVCFFLVYATQRTANCAALGILIVPTCLWYRLHARRDNACIRIYSVTQQSSRIELYFRHRVPYSSGWIANPATRECLRFSWRPLPFKPILNDYSRCVHGDLTARKRNSIKVSLCIGGYFWNWTVAFCIELNVPWTEVQPVYGIVEQQKIRCRDCVLTFTDLLTYCRH